MSVYIPKNSKYYHYDFQASGQRFKGTTGTNVKRVAKRVEAEKRAEIHELQKAGSLTNSDATVDAVFNRYFINYAKDKASAMDQARHLEKALDFLGTSMKWRDFSTEHVAAILEDYKATGVSDSTVNRRKATLRQVYYKARDIWLLPCKHINWTVFSYSEAPPRDNYVTPEQAIRLLDRLPNHMQLIVLFALATGCRLGEFVRWRGVKKGITVARAPRGLTWDRVFLDDRRIKVYTKSRKVDATRWVDLSDDALAILAQCPHGAGDSQVFDATNFKRHWDRARREEGIKNFRFHDLRHTYATWLGQRGAGLHVIQKALGHSNIQTTLRYTHAVQQDVREANKRLPSLTGPKLVEGKRRAS